MDRIELENKMREEKRLPPGQVATQKFPVLHYGAVPTIDLSKWCFRIYGEVKKEIAWTWKEFSALPRRKIKMDLHCVTRWSMFDTNWEGIFVNDLINQGVIEVNKKAQFVIQHAANDFSANLPLEIVLADNFLLATHYEGKPITPDHGYPVRGLVGAIPGKPEQKDVYLWKGAKWLHSLEFSKDDKLGFWEKAGYHNDADIWKEERFS